MQLASARNVVLILLMVVSMVLVGCDNHADNDAYQKGVDVGYARGIGEFTTATNEARKEGYQAGFEKGFVTAAPGKESIQKPWKNMTAKYIAMLGLVKIALLLLLCISYLFRQSHIQEHFVGKLLAMVLAGLTAFWISGLQIDTGRWAGAITISAPKAWYSELVLMLSFASMMFCAMAAFRRLFLNSRDTVVRDALGIFLASLLLQAVLDVGIDIWRVPDLARYSSYSSLMGILIGGSVYLMRMFLMARPGEIFGGTQPAPRR